MPQTQRLHAHDAVFRFFKDGMNIHSPDAHTNLQTLFHTGKKPQIFYRREY